MVVWTDVEAEWLHGDALQDSAQAHQSLRARTRMPDLDDYDRGRTGFFVRRGLWDTSEWFEHFEFDW